eukprot:CAMPEP_0179236374 /NCGR_PEP_ID=MMETSP0797-20121207/13896_1 /TAXON_ID=47934 /ORGANISM="Dinophysis acuminata, Strain DAEP01" /LENGTH=43 /DNA_ID= /DNA_START= /DNA_END= /DNA_ORIENTATION=
MANVRNPNFWCAVVAMHLLPPAEHPAAKWRESSTPGRAIPPTS